MLSFAASNDLLLSFVICTHNRAQILRPLLSAIGAQTTALTDTEVIVVANCCSDETADVVGEFSGTIPRLQLAFEHEPGLSRARNCGFFKSEGVYLAYLDDDVVLTPHYVDSLRTVLSTEAPDLCGGPVYPLYPDGKPQWFPDELEVREYEKTSGWSTTCKISGGNFVVKRSVLERLGLFDPDFGMKAAAIGMLDDRKLVEDYRNSTLRGEQRVYYSLACSVFHSTARSKLTLDYIVRRAFSMGHASCRLFREARGISYYGKATDRLRRSLVKLLDTLLDHHDALLSAEGGPVRMVALILKDFAWALGFVTELLELERFAADSPFRQLYFAHLEHSRAAVVLLGSVAAAISPELAAEAEGPTRFLLERISATLNVPAGIPRQSALHGFNERAYLDANPDVAAAVADGSVPSGAVHYLHYGSKEGRSSDPHLRVAPAPQRPTPIDVLYLVEHQWQELDLACVAKATLQGQKGYSVEVRPFHAGAANFLREVVPRVVVVPSTRILRSSVIEDCLDRWPDALFLNLAQEQADWWETAAKPCACLADAAERFTSCAWRADLHGHIGLGTVGTSRIAATGNPFCSLYGPMYEAAYSSRMSLAEKHLLDPYKPWILISARSPWTLHWRDVSAAKHGSAVHVERIREYSERALREVLRWCKACHDLDVEFIVRPEAGVDRSDFEQFVARHVGDVSKLKLIKTGFTREWIGTCDLVMASSPGFAMEAAFWKRPSVLLQPFLPPESPYKDWKICLPRVTTAARFREVCQQRPLVEDDIFRLARKEMAREGHDALLAIVEEIGKLVESSRRADTRQDRRLGPVPSTKQYYFTKGHEDDIFTAEHVKRLMETWEPLVRAGLSKLRLPLAENSGYPPSGPPMALPVQAWRLDGQ